MPNFQRRILVAGGFCEFCGEGVASELLGSRGSPLSTLNPTLLCPKAFALQTSTMETWRNSLNGLKFLFASSKLTVTSLLSREFPLNKLSVRLAFGSQKNLEPQKSPMGEMAENKLKIHIFKMVL